MAWSMLTWKILRIIQSQLLFKQSLFYLSENTELKIYVVISNGHRSKINHTTIAEYCSKNNINY